MRTAAFAGRICSSRSVLRAYGHPSSRWLGQRSQLLSNLPLRCLRTNQPRCYRWRRCSDRYKTTTVLLAALSPAAFLDLAENGNDHDSDATSESEMLAASRDEVEKRVPKEVNGIAKVYGGIFLLLDKYVIEVVATAFRFLRLVTIFVPVLATTPAIWLGRRVKNRDHERTGTLWWYQLLVSAMERAGPAFIKVRPPIISGIMCGC